MKKYYSLILTFILVVIAFRLFPVIINRISNSQIIDNDRLSGSQPLSFITLNDKARKVPSFLMTNQDQLMIGNEDFHGKVYIVEFFFTTCPSICPIMNKNMKRLEAEFGNRNDFGIASFTIDPDHDTPKVLKEYSKQDKSMRLLSYRVLLEKFNKTYGKKLNESQKLLLKKYISGQNAKLVEHINKEAKSSVKKIKGFANKIDDKITSIKLKEVSNQLQRIEKSNLVNESYLITMMNVYELLEELGRVN